MFFSNRVRQVGLLRQWIWLNDSIIIAQPNLLSLILVAHNWLFDGVVMSSGFAWGDGCWGIVSRKFVVCVLRVWGVCCTGCEVCVLRESFSRFNTAQLFVFLRWLVFDFCFCVFFYFFFGKVSKSVKLTNTLLGVSAVQCCLLQCWVLSMRWSSRLELPRLYLVIIANLSSCLI